MNSPIFPRNCTHSEHATKAAVRKSLKSGAPGEIRTPDLLLRRQSKQHGPTTNQAFIAAPTRRCAALLPPIEHILHTTIFLLLLSCAGTALAQLATQEKTPLLRQSRAAAATNITTEYNASGASGSNTASFAMSGNTDGHWDITLFGFRPTKSGTAPPLGTSRKTVMF